jgi:hypothetical protein
MTQYVNLDAAETIFFERELESVKSRTYDVIRAPLKAMELIPVSTDAGAGAETVRYEQYDMTGIAKIVANYADDLPRANVKGKEFVSLIQSIGNSFGYSLQEVRAAQFAGKSLEQRKASAAARAQREKWNRLAFFGDAEYGIQGWLTNPNIPTSAVADGAGGDTEWDTKTTDEILADMNDAVTGIIDLTNGAEQPDTIVLPIAQYRKISTTRADSGTDTTVLQYFLANNPGMSVEWANELKGAVGGEDVMIVYRNDPEALTLEIPSVFEMLPVQERGLEYVVPCHSRFGGCIVYYPLSMVFKTGI